MPQCPVGCEHVGSELAGSDECSNKESALVKVIYCI